MLRRCVWDAKSNFLYVLNPFGTSSQIVYICFMLLAFIHFKERMTL
jgi:hypothetical protein